MSAAGEERGGGGGPNTGSMAKKHPYSRSGARSRSGMWPHVSELLGKARQDVINVGRGCDSPPACQPAVSLFEQNKCSPPPAPQPAARPALPCVESPSSLGVYKPTVPGT